MIHSMQNVFRVHLEGLNPMNSVYSSLCGCPTIISFGCGRRSCEDTDEYLRGSLKNDKRNI